MSHIELPAETGLKVSPNLISDPAGQAWLKVYEPGSIIRGWDSGDVDWALEHAHRLLRRIGGRIGPPKGAGYWPAIVRELDDYDQVERSRRVESGDVSLMDAALQWVWRYLRERPLEREALQRWCFCKETGTPYEKLLRELGMALTTAKRRRLRGSLYIAAGLCAAEVRIPREVLLARLERARSEVRNDADDPAAVAAREDTASPEPVDVPPFEPNAPGWPIALFWEEVLKAQDVEDEAERGDAVLRLIFERIRAECTGTDLNGADLALLNRRRLHLVAEAIKRGFLDRAARRTRNLSQDELADRIRQLKGDA